MTGSYGGCVSNSEATGSREGCVNFEILLCDCLQTKEAWRPFFVWTCGRSILQRKNKVRFKLNSRLW